MLIKVCGIKIQENLDALIETGVDMVGYNYYPQSKRYLDHSLSVSDSQVKKIGVFVNEDLEKIKELVKREHLDYAQLHGDESVEFCKSVQTFTKVIKVFRIDAQFDFSSVEEFEFCDLLLFDTFTSEYGGSGKTFDWDRLSEYDGDTEFLLSGGIGPESVSQLQKITHPKYIGIDINSRFEISPGIKDVNLVKSFVNELKKTQIK